MPAKVDLDISLDSDLQRVRELSQPLAELGRKLGFSPEAVAEIELAVCEAVNNAIIHAYHQQPGHPVRVLAKPVAGQLLIQVIDQGQPPPPGLPKPTRPAAANFSLEEGGRGLAIIHATMNEVSHRRTAAGNVLEMRRQLPQ